MLSHPSQPHKVRFLQVSNLKLQNGVARSKTLTFFLRQVPLKTTYISASTGFLGRWSSHYSARALFHSEGTPQHHGVALTPAINPSEALPVRNCRTRLIVFSLEDPHLLKCGLHHPTSHISSGDAVWRRAKIISVCPLATTGDMMAKMDLPSSSSCV